MFPALLGALIGAEALTLLAVWLLRRRASALVTVPLAISCLARLSRRVSSGMLLAGHGPPWAALDALILPSIVTFAHSLAALAALALYWDGSPWLRRVRGS